MTPGNHRRGLGKAPSDKSSPATTPFIDNLSLIPVAGDPLDDLAAHIDGTFVLVVRVTGRPDDPSQEVHYRRRCFLSAASAERAARKAVAAGYGADVFLAELRPLWRLSSRAVAS